jgi:hypothetical protein
MSSIYTSTYAQMNPEFGVSQLLATVGLSMFVLGCKQSCFVPNSFIC